MATVASTCSHGNVARRDPVNWGPDAGGETANCHRPIIAVDGMSDRVQLANPSASTPWRQRISRRRVSGCGQLKKRSDKDTMMLSLQTAAGRSTELYDTPEWQIECIATQAAES
jgi:hypothetical protein